VEITQKDQKIKKVSIDISSTLLEAIKRMDELDGKLLLVFDGDEYRSLLSIGDIQRALLKQIPLEATLDKAMRDKVRTCNTEDPDEHVRKMMLDFRAEFMPILDSNGKLANVIFWEELIDTDKRRHSSSDLNLPVIIMAGGQGTRLRPITNIIPKPLVPLGEKPIMQVIVEDFASLGVKQFYASVNYKAEMIEQYFASLPNKTYEIEYFMEDKPLGTAGSLSLLKNKINSTFFVSNCDILIDQDYSEVYKYHKENKNDLTALAALRHYKIPYGTMDVGSGGVLKELKEKPELTFMVNAGVYILEPHLLDEIPENEFFHITHLMEKIMKRGGKVGVFPVSEKSWMDIGEWKEYDRTQELFKRWEK
jgi:dTDP-glucose pyrophosphorylase/CBS domain-containing protein